MVDNLIEDGRRVILCGGTGLYLRALLHGLCEAPAVEPGHTEAFRSRLAAEGLAPLHRELMAVDPVSATKISVNDKQRIERALGVFKTTGKPLSQWQAEQASLPQLYSVHWIGLRWTRPQLWKRIEVVDSMLSEGWIDEENLGRTRV